jgi:cellulose synthase (UDP-forming)
MQAVANRDLLVVGALTRVPALPSLLRDGPLQVANNKLTLQLPDAFQDIRALLTDAPGSAERTRASVALDEAGEGLGIILGTQSNLMPGRSVVAVTGMTPAAVAASTGTVRDREGGARVQGDLTLVQSGQTTFFRTASGYDLGSLPPWLWPQRWFGNRPERAIVLLLAASCLLGVPLYWMLRRRAAIRLRARTLHP